MVSGSQEATENAGFQARVGVMLVIFLVSLFGMSLYLQCAHLSLPHNLLASSFPSISKRAKFLHIPKIVFFIGKHFGTGEQIDLTIA